MSDRSMLTFWEDQGDCDLPSLEAEIAEVLGAISIASPARIHFRKRFFSKTVDATVVHHQPKDLVAEIFSEICRNGWCGLFVHELPERLPILGKGKRITDAELPEFSLQTLAACERVTRAHPVLMIGHDMGFALGVAAEYVRALPGR